MLEGLEVQEATLSEVLEASEGIRIDSAFFLCKKLLDKLRSLHSVPLRELSSKITQGPNPSFVESGYPCLTGRNIIDDKISLEESDQVSAEDFTSYKDFWLKNNDILVTLKGAGSTGKVAIFSDNGQLMFSRNIGLIRLKPKSTIRPKAIYAFLACQYGQILIDRGVTGGTGQLTLPTGYLKSMPIPVFDNTLSAMVEECVDSYEKNLSIAADQNKQAEQILLRSLGLENWQPPEPLTYQRKASEAFAVERLDAEHFQPKYLALLAHIKKHASRCRRIRDVAGICYRGEQPEYYEDGSLAVITSKHILENGLDYGNFDSTASDYWDRPKFKEARILKYDILTYTTGAKVGRTAVYLENEKALASNHVNLLRLKEENPAYVATIMNSMIGRMQTRMMVTGSAQVELYPHDIEEFLIPFVNEKAEAEIVSAIESAHMARKQARSLLDRAKRAVEIAIEKNEADAIVYLKGTI